MLYDVAPLTAVHPSVTCPVPPVAETPVGAGGGNATVTVVLPDAPPGAVAVIVAVPFATAVTTPVDAFTVATPVLLLDHVNVTPLIVLFDASFAVAVICCVAPVAVSVGVAGVTFTVAPRTPRRIVPPPVKAT
jgi:hypothetical protein